MDLCTWPFVLPFIWQKQTNPE